MHNEESFCLFTTYLLNQVSSTTKQPLSVNTIETYVEAAEFALSKALGFRLMAQRFRWKALIRQGRSSRQAPRGDRRKRQGVRRYHLRQAAAALWPDPEDKNSLNLWAAACVAQTLLMRAGELEHIRMCDIARQNLEGRPCYLVHVLALKKGAATAGRRYPVLIPAAHGPDSACAFAALERLLSLDPRAGRDPGTRSYPGNEEPLFILRPPRGHNPRAIVTGDMLAYCRRIATIAGLPAGEVGAHSLRIGGATDHADGGGTKEEVTTRGRWDGDLAEIYARDTVGRQFAATDAINRAQSASIEEIRVGWAQPGR